MDKPLDAALVWFRRDLRADDHAALYHALQGGAPGLVRLRLRPRHPRPAAARRPARRVHPSTASPRSTRDLRALGERHGMPASRLLVRHGRGARRDRRAGRATLARAGGVRQPRRRPVRARARRPVRGRARRPRASRCTPRRTTWSSSATRCSRQRQAVQRVHAVQERLARRSSTPFFLKAVPGRARMPPRWRRCPTASTAALPTLAALGFARPTCTRCTMPGRQRGGRRAARRLPRPHRRLRRRRATSRRSRARATCRCTCASARSRSATGRRGARAHRRGAAGSARGAETWLSELIWRDFYHRCCTTIPHVVGASFKPEYDRDPLRARHAMPTSCSPPGAKAAPATRWSTRRWRRSTRPATCTTGCAWSPRASSSRTSASTGAAASATSPST